MQIGSEDCDYSGANCHPGEPLRFSLLIDGSPPSFVGIFKVVHILLACTLLRRWAIYYDFGKGISG
jgi:hypothetical protein